jgi:hypothetical protein
LTDSLFASFSARTAAAVADEIRARIVVVGDHVNRLLLTLLREVHCEFGDRRLQIEMSRVERTMFDCLQRQFDHLARRIAVLEAPSAILRRLVGGRVEQELGSRSLRVSFRADFVAAGVAVSDLTIPSMAFSRSSAVRFSLVVMSGRAWKPFANWEGFM